MVFAFLAIMFIQMCATLAIVYLLTHSRRVQSEHEDMIFREKFRRFVGEMLPDVTMKEN